MKNQGPNPQTTQLGQEKQLYKKYRPEPMRLNRPTREEEHKYGGALNKY